VKLSPPYNGYAVAPKMIDCGVIFRRARKEHKCDGAHDGEKIVPCLLNRPIQREMYVEYYGETGSFRSGERMHFECAATRGLVIRESKNVP